MDRLKTLKSLVNITKIPDIYSGEEKIKFSDRHPIFKTLMKLEFEDVLRNFNHERYF
jgi:hypothetical protein